jgi:aryl-alcohol dehydrogenase-like predicted oxidoreductase
METLDLLVRQGKVRYVGCSNYSAWRLTHALWASDKHNWVRYDSIQPHYNLVHRAEFERELRDVCTHFGLGVIPYSPLAGGFLTGKYRRHGDVTSARAESVRSRYMNDKGFAVLDALDALAAPRGATVLQVALAWQLHLGYVTAPIIGANTVAQLEESLGACALELSGEEMARLKEASSWE